MLDGVEAGSLLAAMGARAGGAAGVAAVGEDLFFGGHGVPSGHFARFGYSMEESGRRGKLLNGLGDLSVNGYFGWVIFRVS